jgi:hypothetical protein
VNIDREGTLDSELLRESIDAFDEINALASMDRAGRRFAFTFRKRLSRLDKRLANRPLCP